jgi:peptidoglycan/LPS O-acetylase OafA/YrhL
MENNLPKIYSKRAILGFSIFLSVLFGGVLLYQNLIDVKKKKEACIVLGISIVLTIITIFIGSFQESPKSSYAYLCGLLGGCLLSYYFVPKYFPNEEQYPKKPIWKPLIVAVIIIAIFMMLIIYGGSFENA